MDLRYNCRCSSSFQRCAALARALIMGTPHWPHSPRWRIGPATTAHIDVTAQNLNEERCGSIQTGASTYTLNLQRHQSARGGDKRAVDRSCCQVPDAAPKRTPSGIAHSAANNKRAAVSLNGVIMPDGIRVFGKTLPPQHDSPSMDTHHGSHAAEVRLSSAGVIVSPPKRRRTADRRGCVLYGEDTLRSSRAKLRRHHRSTPTSSGDLPGNGGVIESRKAAHAAARPHPSTVMGRVFEPSR